MSTDVYMTFLPPGSTAVEAEVDCPLGHLACFLSYCGFDALEEWRALEKKHPVMTEALVREIYLLCVRMKIAIEREKALPAEAFEAKWGAQQRWVLEEFFEPDEVKIFQGYLGWSWKIYVD